MSKERVLTVLTVVNLGILVLLLFLQLWRVQASGPAAVLRGGALEIVDAQGMVRASLHIEPAGPARLTDGSLAKDGKIYPETVLFRLIRPDGRPSVKIATSEEGSALTLGGGIDPTYIVINAQGGDPSVALTNKDGRLQILKPQISNYLERPAGWRP